MSHPSANELAMLTHLDYEVREVFAERAHHIGEALDLDPSFCVGEDPRSTLARALMKDAVAIAAARVGMSVVSVTGGARNLQSFDGNIDRRYRVRKAVAQPDGTFLIPTNSEAILQLDGDSMFKEERWVLGYTLAPSNQLDVVFVAEILEVIEGNPGYLVLGTVHRLESSTRPPTGFMPTDEGLEGFDDDEDEEAGGSDVG